jgi:hypothetical protein
MSEPAIMTRGRGAAGLDTPVATKAAPDAPGYTVRVRTMSANDVFNLLSQAWLQQPIDGPVVRQYTASNSAR